MSASKALDHIRRHGSPRDVQTALYYVTRGRTAPLLELARAVTPAAAPDDQHPVSARPVVTGSFRPSVTVELPA